MLLLKSLVNPILSYKVTQASSDDIIGKNKVIATAIFQKAEEANDNGMCFSKPLLSGMVDGAQSDINERHMLGELGHPQDLNDINRMSTIDLSNTSHVITSLNMNGNFVEGSFETLDTPSGNILAALLKSRIKIGVSIRATSTDEVNYDVYDVNHLTNVSLVTYDAVHMPAYPSAYVTSIMSSVFKISPNNLVKKINSKQKVADVLYKTIISKKMNNEEAKDFVYGFIKKLKNK